MQIKPLFLTLCAIALPSMAARTCRARQRGGSSTSPGQPAATSTSNSTSGLAGGTIAAAWYPSWYSTQLPPEQISWSKYNTVTFAFATTTSDPSTIALDDVSTALLPKFVAQAKSHNVAALISVGGWTGSLHYSSAVATADSRTKFATALLDLVKKYGADGIDFDWEYPGKQGIGCNEVSGSDSANFLSLLQEIRKDSVGSRLILTAAVGQTPFAGADGNPMTDVSAFAKELDFIAIMAYDIWGSWSSTIGPNAPLNDACAATKAGSGSSSVESWTGAGFPVNQVVLGVPSYGRSYTIAADQASKLGDYPTFTSIPLGEGETGASSTDVCGNTVPGNSGLFNFNGMIQAGFLKSDGTAASGMTYKFDDCSQTPFLYDPAKQMVISYDDATSFAAKGKYIASKGLKGFAMWHIAGDSNDILVNSIHQALGA